MAEIDWSQFEIVDAPVVAAAPIDMSQFEIVGLPQPTRTWSDTFTDYGKSLAKGVYGAGEFANQITQPGNQLGASIAQALTGQYIPTNIDMAEAERLSVYGNPSYNGAGLIEKAIGKGIETTPYALMGGGAAPAFSSGVVGELAKAVGLPEWTGNVVGGMVPGIARKGISSIANTIGGEDFADEAKSLQQQALGAKYADYVKSAKNTYIDPASSVDDVETAVRTNIQKAVDFGTFDDIAKDPQTLFKANSKVINEQTKQLNQELKLVDQAISGRKIFPTKNALTLAKEYVQKAPVTDQDDLAKYLDDYVKTLKKKSDGTVSFLQQEKRALGKKVYAGKDVGKEVIDKYIQADLSKIIETVSDKAVNSGRVKELNSVIEAHMTLDPIFRRSLGADEASSFAGQALQAQRTSGGYLTGPTLKGMGMGAAAGSTVAPGVGTGLGALLGGALGNAYGRTLGYLNSPDGKFALSSTLKKLDAPRKGASSVLDAIGVKAGVPQAIQSGAIPYVERGREIRQEQTQPQVESKIPVEQKPVFPSPIPQAQLLNGEASDQKSQPQERQTQKATAQQPKSNTQAYSNNPVSYDPNQLKSYIKSQDPLIQAVIAVESRGNPQARSKAGAYGLMQLMPGTAKDLGVDPRDPLQNIKGGTAYLSQMLSEFRDTKLALAAYNGGPARVKAAMKAAQKRGKAPTFENIRHYLPKETQQYPVRVAGALSEIKRA